MNSQILDYVFQYEKLDEGYQKKMEDYNSQILPVQKHIRKFKKVKFLTFYQLRLPTKSGLRPRDSFTL